MGMRLEYVRVRREVAQLGLSRSNKGDEVNAPATRRLTTLPITSIPLPKEREECMNVSERMYVQGCMCKNVCKWIDVQLPIKGYKKV